MRLFNVHPKTRTAKRKPRKTHYARRSKSKQKRTKTRQTRKPKRKTSTKKKQRRTRGRGKKRGGGDQYGNNQATSVGYTHQFGDTQQGATANNSIQQQIQFTDNNLSRSVNMDNVSNTVSSAPTESEPASV